MPSTSFPGEELLGQYSGFLLLALSFHRQGHVCICKYAFYFLISHLENISTNWTPWHSYKAWKFKEISFHRISYNWRFHKQSCVSKEWHILIHFEELILLLCTEFMLLFKIVTHSYRSALFSSHYIKNYLFTLSKLEEAP